MKNLFRIAFVMLCVSIFAGLTATDSFGQSRDGEEREERIELTKNARKNGYQIRRKDGEVFVRITNVVNPFDKKPLEGLHKIFYQCKEGDEEFEINNVKFLKGNTDLFTAGECIDDFSAFRTLGVVADGS